MALRMAFVFSLVAFGEIGQNGGRSPVLTVTLAGNRSDHGRLPRPRMSTSLPLALRRDHSADRGTGQTTLDSQTEHVRGG